VCRAAYQLRQLRPLIRSLSFDVAKLLVQAFISTRLDYCNSLLHGISDNLYRRLQAVQNAAARLITNTRRCEHLLVLVMRRVLRHFERPSCSSYIGCQSANVFNSLSPCWCTRHCTTSSLHTWRKTANLRLSLDTDDCVPRTPTRA